MPDNTYQANTTTFAYYCEDCGWTGDKPTEIEHPRNEFPSALLCPECSSSVTQRRTSGRKEGA